MGLVVVVGGGGHGGHVGIAPAVALPGWQGGGQTGCGAVPVADVLLSGQGQAAYAGQAVPGGQGGGGWQGGHPPGCAGSLPWGASARPARRGAPGCVSGL